MVITPPGVRIPLPPPRFSVLVPESPQEFTRHLLTALVAMLVQRGYDRAVAEIAPERVVDAAQYGLQFLAVLTVLAGRVARIISHAVHVSLPFDLSFAKDTYLPHPKCPSEAIEGHDR